MRHVYRRPRDYAQHAAVLTLQPQPEWAIEAVGDAFILTERQATVGLAPTINCTADAFTLSEGTAVIGGNITVACNADSFVLTEGRASAGIYRVIDTTGEAFTLTEGDAEIVRTQRTTPIVTTVAFGVSQSQVTVSASQSRIVIQRAA